MVATNPDSLNDALARGANAGLQSLVDDLTGSSDLALARIWLLQSDDRCDICRSRAASGQSDFALHLAASGGRSRNSERPEIWNRLDGASHRFSLNGQKIGRIGATGEPLIIPRAADEPALTNPGWLVQEKIESFFGFPLLHAGRVLGVLAVFLRRELDDRDLASLRQLADSSARLVAATEVIHSLQSRLDHLTIENEHVQRDWRSAAYYGPLIARGAASRKWDQQIHLAAGHQQPVLITGEAGSGKEFTARWIHQRSPDAVSPFIKLDAATDSKLIDDWLSSIDAQPSPIPNPIQNCGTIFLDRIEGTPPALQMRLAAWMSDRRGLDAGNLAQVRPRIIAASGSDLAAEIASGNFQQGLYCALSVSEIAVPALRNRLEDLPELASFLLQNISRSAHPPGFVLDAAKLDWLRRREWPINVRELRHALEDIAWRTANGRAEAPSPCFSTESAAPLFVSAEELKHQERANVLACLERCHWKVYGRGGAAEMLGLKPTTLIYRMKVHGIAKPKS